MNSHKDIILARLSEDFIDDLANFNCIDYTEANDFPSKKRKRIEDLSRDMNDFLRDEALMEQEAGFNTTTLLYIDKKLYGYISLCSDAIKLSEDEKIQENVPYESIPCIKIARLAIDNKFHGQGWGKFLVNFAVHQAFNVRHNICGVKFLTVDCFQHRLDYYRRMGFEVNSVQKENRKPHHPISLRLNIDDYVENPSAYDVMERSLGILV